MEKVKSGVVYVPLAGTGGVIFVSTLAGVIVDINNVALNVYE
jgi:hypothetical protein